jgi:hypothetical protein
MEARGITVADLRLQEVASGLSQPLFLAGPPGDGRLFILEQPGRVRLVKNGRLLATPFVDVSDRVNFEATAQGLLGMAFHPNWGSNARFYLYYIGGQGSGEAVLSEFTAPAADADVADPATESVILTVQQFDVRHNGGTIAFGRDTYLYLGLGDGGGQSDPRENGQDANTLLGSMLRIDVGRSSRGKAYAIPEDNPFANAHLGAPEVYAIGLREPWRWSFDRETGDVYIADVGQARVEELSVVSFEGLRNANFGWDHREGSECFNDPQSNPPGDQFTPLSECKSGTMVPIVEYKHVGAYIPEQDRAGNSITGGYVYRGSCLPDIRGTYFYGDFASNFVRTLVWDGESATNQNDITESLGTPIRALASFGEDGFGELYVVDHEGGTVYRVVAGS